MKKKNPFFKGLFKNIVFVVLIFITLGLFLGFVDLDELNKNSVEEVSSYTVFISGTTKQALPSL
jgi:hypothetical protein